jgi:diguanylate cyclase (GGDEF)-like protein/PAS domain S-box-containing protein
MKIRTQYFMSAAIFTAALLLFSAIVIFRYTDSLDNRKDIFLLLILCLFVSPGVFLIASFHMVTKRVLKSIAALHSGIGIIGSGNLDYTIREGKDDEAGELFRAFNQMANDLKRWAMKRAAKAEEGEHILNMLMESIPEGVIFAEAPGSTVRIISKFLSGITGVSVEEAEGKDSDFFDSRCVYPETPAEYPVSKAIRRKEPTYKQECSLDTPDGTTITLLTDTVPISGRDGTIIGALSTWRDITDQKKVTDELRRNEYELRTILGDSPDIIVRFDRSLRYKYANPAFKRVTGLLKEHIEGRTNVELGINKELMITIDEALHKVIETGDEISIEFEMMFFSGKHYFWGKMIPEFDKTGFVDMVLLIARDITDRKNAEEQIRYISFHDQVTGLYNRAYFEEEMRRIDNARELPASIIMGDMNNLKLTNDALGHSEGDKLINRIAEILRVCCRKEDIIARWGGDEFVAILPKTDFTAANEVGGRIIEECENVRDMLLGPSMAIGIGVKHSHDTSIYHALRTAEENMYKKKAESVQKNRERVISALSDAVINKHPEIAGHIERMKSMIRQIIPVLKLSLDDEEKLLLTAELHELGKISVPDNIWLKQGSLSCEEMDEMKKQNETSFRIASSFSEYAPVSGLLLALNERWDGEGYPHRTKEYEIPYLARVYVLLDAFDAMTNPRPYAPVLSEEEALIELEKGSGTLFDPDIVKKFVRSVKKNRATDVRILLADDHALFRSGTAQLLTSEPGFLVIGQANDGQEAIKLARKLKPDIILMDINMPGVNGIEAARAIHHESPEIPIIGLSMHDDEEHIRAMREAGAAGFINKGCDPDEIIRTIRKCVQGNL